MTYTETKKEGKKEISREKEEENTLLGNEPVEMSVFVIYERGAQKLAFKTEKM